MILKGIDFGPVWGASGTLNFDGNGWPHHKVFKHVGLNFGHSTFVAKTTTIDPRPGNMPLRRNLQPKELKPKCIVVKYRKGVVLNSVGLSGPGAQNLLERNIWQPRTMPFFLSFMAIGPTTEERLEETRRFAILLAEHLPHFTTRIGLQVNVSCPNVGKKPRPRHEFVAEVHQMLQILGVLGIPLVVKLSATTDVETGYLIAYDHLCDAICIPNSIPWGQLAEEVDWKGIFGTDISPLVHLGGGGLSGKPLLPIAKRWVARAKKMNFPKPINAGGGILSARDAIELFEAGADSVSLGSVAILRPWRVQRIIHAVHAYHGVILP